MTTEEPANEPASEIAPAPPLTRGRTAVASARQDTQFGVSTRISQAALAAAVRELRTRRRRGKPPA